MPGTVYHWKVTVQDNHGQIATAESTFETGLMDVRFFADHAQWITSGWDTKETGSPVFIRHFSVKQDVVSARLYATCLGIYEAELNGEPVGNTYFAPGWTSYHKRLQYQTYPLEVKPGENELRFTLGNGWYKGALGFTPIPNHYGDTLALLAIVVVTYADGRSEIIGIQKSQIKYGKPISIWWKLPSSSWTLTVKRNWCVRCI